MSSVEPIRNSDILRLEKELMEHRREDKTQFSALNHKQDHMAGQLDVLVDNQASLMGALGVNRQEGERDHKPLALVGQRQAIWTLLGGMGGLLAADKILLAIWPYIWQMLMAVANIK